MRWEDYYPSFIFISAFFMHISYVLTSAANPNLSLLAAEVWCSPLPVIDSAESQQSISQIGTPEARHVVLSYFWKLPLFLCCWQPKRWFWVSELLTWHSVPTSFFQWELLRELKGREKKVGGREGIRQEGKKKKKKVTLFLALLLYFYAENQHVYLQPFNKCAAPATDQSWNER